MAKTKISEFDTNPALNTDIDSINIAEGCAPSGINNAIRELMSQLKNQQDGSSLDTFTVGNTLTVNGANSLRLADTDSSNYVGLKAPSTVAANYTLTLPTADGTSGQVLSTNGSGALSFVSGSAGDVTLTGTQTLTNKRITPRVSTTTSSATPTINTDNVDQYGLTAQAVDITSFTTNLSGTPTNGQKLWIYIVGTAARAITWGTSFESSTATLPTTTVTTNRLDIGFVWNAATSKWRCVATA